MGTLELAVDRLLVEAPYGVLSTRISLEPSRIFPKVPEHFVKIVEALPEVAVAAGRSEHRVQRVRLHIVPA
ncbi:hypothetical protein [Nocardiopsis valliformis]|uniref:hypothetical protein n=1 Tax=Nocardiopsis valliformis TaxID=239974 RepID=UPI0003465B34|nr:hypothetical protein [Nocardiopsis valliformis]